MSYKQSTKKKLKNQTIENKIILVVLILGAILSCVAPFVHMLFPKKSNEILVLEAKFEKRQIAENTFNIQMSQLKQEQKFIGFSNQRKFWFAIGKPILVLYLALYLLFIYPLISDYYLKKTTKILALLTTTTAMYFIVWTLWYRADFPKQLYYILIGIASIVGTFIATLMINYRQSLRFKIEKLIKFISIDAYFKYIRQEDKDNYIEDSFSIYDDITQNDYSDER